MKTRELTILLPKDWLGEHCIEDVWWDYIGPHGDICEGISDALQAIMDGLS